MTSPDSTSDVVSRMIDALYVSDPELDTSIGTPLRKFLDTVGQEISKAKVDSYLLNYQYDVDSKTAGALDDFCANFGIARLGGTRATGVVTFSRSAEIANIMAVNIPPGSQVTTMSIPEQTFQTTVSTIMDIGVQSVDIPVQALTAGPDGNILANTPLQLASNINGVSTVSNSAAFLGGTLDETDAQLRARFKSSVFRNLAGTDSMYRGVALQTLANLNSGSFGVAQVNILGATTHNTEQIQITSGTGTSAIATAAYIFPQSLTITDQSGNTYNYRTHYTYTVTQATPNDEVAHPASLTITAVSGSTFVDGIYNVEYDYVPIVSRNDPFNTRFSQGIVSNRVDVYCNGQNSASAVQPISYVNTVKFTNTATDPLYRLKFVDAAGNHPATNDVFIPLGFGPILSIPATLKFTGSASVYAVGTNYDIVHQDDAFGYSPNSLYGIWWKVGTSPAPPANNATVTDGATPPVTTMTYTYNSVPWQVQSNLANWRLLGTDVQVHAGKPIYLTFNFAVVYDRGATPATVNTNVISALDAFLKRLGFNAAVQVSDIIQVAHNVVGVDNIRLTSSTDNPTNYGIQHVLANGTAVGSPYNVSGRPTDVYFDERSYPLLCTANFTAKARNSFRT